MTPTSPGTAFAFGSKGAQNPIELYLEDLFTISSNLAGLPAISIPVSYTHLTLPTILLV